MKLFKYLNAVAIFLLAWLLIIPAFCLAADMRVSNAAALGMCDYLVDRLDVGSGTATGLLRIYTGSAPTTVDDAATGTLLATLTLSNPAFGNCADTNPGARGTASTITGDSSADATGTAGYFRAVNRDGTAVIQGTITATGGGGDLELNSTSISTGVQVDVSSWLVNVPEY